MKKFLTILLLLIASPAFATTYYVRTDGSTATNCTGTTNAAYPGSGTGQACAYSHPWYATGHCSDVPNDCTNGTMSGGDTLIIVSGSFNMGYQTGWDCNASWSYGCVMKPLPDGTSGAHTKLIGCSASGCTDHAGRPELWGNGGSRKVINLNGSDYVDIQDVEITDHAAVGNAHPLYSATHASTEASAMDGIDITSATNISLSYVWIHGVYRYGIMGGPGENFTFDHVDLFGNAYAGYTNDTTGSCTNCGISGTNTFSNVRVRYNGCVENYPFTTGTSGTSASIISEGCWDQNETGYGDGIGFSNTGGTWTFTDCDISHNTSDGLDAIYFNRGSYSDGNITIKRTLAEGNVGAGIKVEHHAVIEDSIVLANCGYFDDQPFARSSMTTCRAGSALAFVWNSATGSPAPTVTNTTVLSNMDIAIGAGLGNTCSGASVVLKNSIILGGYDYNGAGEQSDSYYTEGDCTPTLTSDYNVCYDTKTDSKCNGANDVKSNPLFAGTITLGSTNFPNFRTTEGFADEVYLASNSPARDLSDETVSGADALDFNSYNRGAAWDAGALEYGSTPGETEPPTSGPNVYMGTWHKN